MQVAVAPSVNAIKQFSNCLGFKALPSIMHLPCDPARPMIKKCVCLTVPLGYSIMEPEKILKRLQFQQHATSKTMTNADTNMNDAGVTTASIAQTVKPGIFRSLLQTLPRPKSPSHL